MPVRIQRKRTKGWKAPPGAVYVGRPSKWGNPFEVGEPLSLTMQLAVGIRDEKINDPGTAVFLFRKMLMKNLAQCDSTVDVLLELRGKDLMCWCPLDQPCHADILLELANK